jgi:5-methylcytosine-specific restriction endonuclease McrA
MAGLPKSWTALDMQHALTWWEAKCCYCGDALSNFWAWDHYIPVANRSRRVANPGTTPQNLVPACRVCNTSKSSKHPKLWLVGRYGKPRMLEIVARIEEYFRTCRVPVFGPTEETFSG